MKQLMVSELSTLGYVLLLYPQQPTPSRASITGVVIIANKLCPTYEHLRLAPKQPEPTNLTTMPLKKFQFGSFLLDLITWL